MERTIYVKYLNDRSDRFKIKTRMIEDEEKNKFVIKSAINEQGKQHIKDIYENCSKLKKIFEGSKFTMPEISLEQEEIWLKYVEGKSMEEVLDESIEEGEQCFFKLLKEYAETIYALNMPIIGKCKEKEFVEVFGEIELPENLQMCEYLGIDMTFNNIIMNEEWSIADYEWGFRFAVPANFIIFRAIHYYLNGNVKRPVEKEMKLYSEIGISEEEVKKYRIMEQNFQSYITKGMHPLSSMHNRIGKNTVYLTNENIEENIIKQEKLKMVQIFIDSGKGYSEEESYMQEVTEENGIRKVSVNVKKQIRSVRIDPCNEECVVKIHVAQIYSDGKCSSKEYITNGVNMRDNCILFETGDPQIIFLTENEENCELQVFFEIEIVKKFVLQQLKNEVGEK